MSAPFDPFYIQADGEPNYTRPGVSQSRTQSYATTTSRTTNRSAKLEGVQKDRSPKPLPPRLNIRLALHEEVSSSAVVDPGGDGGSLSQLSIEGKVSVRVESSNANENTPFALHVSGPMTSLATFKCNEHCVLEDEETINTRDQIGMVRCRVDVPKSKVAGCDIFTYSMNVRTQNMPILVQSKAAVSERTCRVSVQIRSNLSNQGDLSNFTIIVAIPTTLRGETLQLTRGNNGVWDANKRIVTWKIGNLQHGESCLVSAEAQVSHAIGEMLRENPFDTKVAAGKIMCPVLVRCLSEVDQVSDLQLMAMALNHNPATIVQNQARSYQLLHRVGKGD